MIIRSLKKSPPPRITTTPALDRARRWAQTPTGCGACNGVRAVAAKMLGARPSRKS